MYLHFFFRSIYCTVIFGMGLQKSCRGVNENRMFVQFCKYFFIFLGAAIIYLDSFFLSSPAHLDSHLG